MKCFLIVEKVLDDAHIAPNPSSENENVGEAERLVRLLKEQTRATYSALSYKKTTRDD